MQEPRVRAQEQRQHRGVHLHSSITVMGGKENPTCRIVLAGFPEPRMRSYLVAAGGDVAKARELYAWNAQMAGAALEQLAHLEVLLRNAVDLQLQKRIREREIGIPWFLMPPFITAQSEAIETVRERLRQQNRETRDQIIAGLSFGFWTGWFGPKYEELWRQNLRLAFPNGSGQRKEIARLVEQIRKFRNRVAHHDSLLNVDIGFEMEAIFQLASIINVEAASWMKSVDRTRVVGTARPITPKDTVLVPSNDSSPFLEDLHAYVCQSGRYFRQVEYLAIYKDRQICMDIARIKFRRDNVLWNRSEARRLQKSEDRVERRLGEVMEAGLAQGLNHGVYQVFLLSQPGDPQHVQLSEPLKNDKAGRSSAFVRKQRYTSIHDLRHATSIWDLEKKDP